MRPLLAAAAVLSLAGPARAWAQDASDWVPLPEMADVSARPDAPPGTGQAIPVEPESPALLEFRQRVRALCAGLPPPPLVVELYRPGMSLSPPPPAQVSAPLAPALPPVLISDTTLHGGRVLGQGKVAGGGWLGVPTFGTRLQVGLGKGWDVGAGYGGVYGQSHELSLVGRRALTDGELELAASVEGSVVFFAQRPSPDGSGARGLAGRRNFNVAPGLHLSKRNAGSSWRWLGHVQGVLSLDTEPVSLLPLGGVPPPLVLSWNLPVMAGAEWPLAPGAVVQLLGGFEIHGRAGDMPFIPVLRAGMLFGN